MTTSDVKELSDEELEFYSRQIVLRDIGYSGQLKLKSAKVCVIGAGGLGCPIVVQLTAMGVGNLRLVDRDVVELSNLQRQHLYDVNSLGYPKVEIAAQKLRVLNPGIRIKPMPISLNMDNAEEIIKGVDVVVDGLDAIEPRYAINRACAKLKIPYVYGAAIMTYGNVSTIIPGETPCLECFYGNLKDEMLPTCAVVGVHPSILGIVASLEVAEVVRIILGKTPQLASNLLYCDMENMNFDKIILSRREECPVCGVTPKGSPPSLKRKLIEEICGRGGKRTFVITPRENLGLNITILHTLLKKRGLNIKVKADLGITFNPKHMVTSSILKSGVMITEGINDKERAIKLYSEIITEGLGIPWTYIK